MLTVNSTQAFRYHWQLLSLLGVHEPRMNTFWHRHYKIYRIIFFIFFYIFIPLTVFVRPMLATSLATLCEGLCIAVPDAFELLKLANVWRVRGELQKTHKIFRQLDKRLSTRIEKDIIGSTIIRAYRILFMLFAVFVLLFGTGFLQVILSNERMLIFPLWVPWNWWDSQSVYIITSSGIILGLSVQALLALNNDTYPVSYLIMVAAHINALGKRVLIIGQNRRLSRSERHQKLIKTIYDHQLILELVNILQSALSMAFFFQFVCTAISQCTAIFFVAFAKTSLARIINMMFVLISITSETLLICYAAEVLNDAGEKLSITIYSSNWLDQSIRYRRDLLFMLMRSQRSTSIRAAGFISVRASTMITVIKGAYTMFALLNEMS